MSGNYLTSRVTTLVPQRPLTPKNPFTVLKQLNAHQWNNFALAFFAWTADALDFFIVSLTATDIATDLNRSVTDITWGITLVLMLRSVGAIAFGLAADRFGRRIPMAINLFLFSVLEIGLGFVTTYKQFLGVRAIFGIAMGGIYGMCAATALDDLPVEARGIMSGFMQQGYAFGYLLATIFYRALVPTTSHGWRSLAWFSAGPPVVLIVWRLFTDETDTFKALKAARTEEHESKAKQFVREGRYALKHYGVLFSYLVLLMAGFNFMSHGSQDLYPTFLKSQLGFSPNLTTVTMVVSNLGALTGGITVGWISDTLGRRLTIIIACILGAVIIPAYTLVQTPAIMAAAFFEQFMVQGAWGVIPAHLLELAPPQYRTFVVGTAYQLGNLASSASSTIEARLGAQVPRIINLQHKKVEDYGKVIAIFLACVFAYVILITFVGPEVPKNERGRVAAAGHLGEDATTVRRGNGEESDDEEMKVATKVESYGTYTLPEEKKEGTKEQSVPVATQKQSPEIL